MMKNRISGQADSLKKRLASDPEFQKKKLLQDEKFAKFEEEIRADELNLVEELRLAGVQVKSVWDLVNTTVPYPLALPVLSRHLLLSHHLRTKEGCARSLTVVEARGIAAKPILKALCDVESHADKNYQWALVMALAMVGDVSCLGEIDHLLRDPLYAHIWPELSSARRKCSKRRFNPTSEGA